MPDPNPIERQDVFDIIEYALCQALPNVVPRNWNLNARILSAAVLAHMELCGVLFSRTEAYVGPLHGRRHAAGADAAEGEHAGAAENRAGGIRAGNRPRLC